MEDEVEELLRELGVHSLYRGQYSAIRAVGLVCEDKSRLYDVVDRIYKVIGDEQGKKWTAIERQIRTVVSVAWRTNSQALANMAGYPLTKPPTVSAFIEILYNYAAHHFAHK